jgi:enoyl-CoA hydratase/carnithine racemase
MTAGCTGAVRRGVLYLTLDTVGSSVNIFTPAVALELESALAKGLAAGARAVVVQSGKPGSFVNGVGLLLAASSHSQAAAMERARTLQRCYETLAAAPVPTLAAVEGNCYGCGLELALTCDYRIARDTYDTHFYMSELRDYAFIPLFGGTQRLPRLLGLSAGMKLLLGERVEAREALRMGLIDRLAPQAGFHRVLHSFLEGLRARGFPKRMAGRPAPRRSPAPQARKAASAATRAIGAVPGPERALARECLRLAKLPLRRGYRLEDGLREELASFWRSIRTPHAERAMSFFFVRQAAKAHAIGSASYERPGRLAVTIDARAPALRDLSRLLRARRLSGVAVGGSRAGAAGRIAFAQTKVRGVFTCALGRDQTDADCRALLPFPEEPIPPIELVPASDEAPWRQGAVLFQLLEQAGFAPVVTRGRDRFVSDRLFAAFADAVGNASLSRARTELLEFGFRTPDSLWRKLRSRTLSPSPTPIRAAGRGKNARGALADRVVQSLAAESIRALDDGALRHAAQADLLVTLLFGFPVVKGGLLRHASAGDSALARDAARVLGRTRD